MKLKQIVFQIKLKVLNIRFIFLAPPEFMPGQKQIFQRNNFVKNF